MSSILTIRDLKVSFPGPGGGVAAVRGLDMELEKGSITGLVGESGSGKSVTARAIMNLLERSTARVEAEQMQFGDTDLLALGPARWNDLRGRHMLMIFQEPGTALDPVFTVGTQMREIISRCRPDTDDVADAAGRALKDAGFARPADILASYPHELSGGLRQLVMIAIALAVRPDLLIADEPTTALDVTSQSRVLDSIRRLRDSAGTAVLLITHDMAVMAQLCDTAMVMYAGRVVEQAHCQTLLAEPRHPYTRGLLDAVPRLSRGTTRPVVPIPGQAPDRTERFTGCAFAARCPRADTLCRERDPWPRMLQGALVACHHAT